MINNTKPNIMLNTVHCLSYTGLHVVREVGSIIAFRRLSLHERFIINIIIIII
jgi:hypothetical protein